MDLSALGSSLPPGLAQTEREMGDKFRASALSITTLYKSALAATKQAYSVGYTSCLSDVLEIVQNSLSESSETGQDAGQALSRLMDWADARKAAMQAFESDEEREEAPPSRAPAPVQRTGSGVGIGISNRAGPSGPRSSLPSHLTQSAPVRPSSAPVTPHSHESVEHRGRSAEPSYLSQSAGPSRSQAPETLHTPAPVHRTARYQPTPVQIPSSSPTAATPSLSPRATRHLPRHSTGTLPSEPGSSNTFAPAIGLEDVPFLSFPSAHGPSMALDAAFGVGSKRPLSAVGGDEMTGVEEAMPALVRSSSVSGAGRGGRRKGPRSSAVAVAVDDPSGGGGGDERERKRTSRRGAGGSSL